MMMDNNKSLIKSIFIYRINVLTYELFLIINCYAIIFIVEKLICKFIL